jgi:hypothetical protein
VSVVYLAGALTDVDPILLETCCLVECFNKLGFHESQVRVVRGKIDNAEESLFPERTRREDECLFVRLTASTSAREVVVVPGTRSEHAASHVHEASMTLAVGPVRSPDTFDSDWTKMLEALKRATYEESQRVFQTSRSHARLGAISAALRKKGIVPPSELR